MLIQLIDRIINTNEIRFVKLLCSDNAGHDRVSVTWRDGTSEVLSVGLEKFEDMCGTIVPAIPGLQLVETYEDESEIGFLDPVPIVAFRIQGKDYYDVTPVTPDGEPSQWSYYAVVHDGGLCLAGEEGRFSSVEEWKTTIQKRAEARKSRQP